MWGHLLPIAAFLFAIPGVGLSDISRQRTIAVLPTVAPTPAISDADLPALLARVQANSALNAKLAENYTSDEFWRNRNFDKNGKATVDESAKYENVFVEGLPYRKRVETNGKPLAGKEAAAEDKRYEKAVRERRALTTDQKRMSLHKSWHSSFPMCCLATLFTNHILGYEQIDGRNMVVVQSVPRPDAQPSNDNEESALNWKQKSWIDATDAIFVRIEEESLNDKNHIAKGMTTRIDFDRVTDNPPDDGHAERAVWLLHTITSQFRFKLFWIGVTGTTEQTWSNYKKFHVDMRLLEDTVTPVGEDNIREAVDHWADQKLGEFTAEQVLIIISSTVAMERCYEIHKREPASLRACAAVFLLAEMEDSRVLQWVHEFLEDNNEAIRWNGLMALRMILEGPLGDEGIATAKKLLTKAESDSDRRLQERAREIRQQLASNPRLCHLEL